MLASMHPVVLGVIALVFTSVVLVLGRMIQNNLLVGKKPPILEGIPFIGGLLKFIKVALRTAPRYRAPPGTHAGLL